ncbi:MAG: hypothetical protein M3438_09035 [Pseudomonadota bacterium]|nr:hypothetical protein [Sphingomonas sp.]MDQ3479287.1 hypothetical protein [Pseudomonadota bacterium]
MPWPELVFDAPGVARASVAAGILLVIFIVHALYFASRKASDGQQRIALDDLTDLSGAGSGCTAGLTVVHGVRQQFDARTRNSTPAVLALPDMDAPPSAGLPLRIRGAKLFSNEQVLQTLICDDDLTVRDSVLFFQPLKIAGDLIVEGDAIFLQPVIVNGVMRVTGTAHFAAGVVAKGDAMIEGALAVGSDCEPGWAVIRELGLEHRLKLNGTLVAGRAVEFRRAA